jgi:hypothetical protein
MKKLPDHFFVSSTDGALFDLRRDRPFLTPLRADYARSHRVIETGLELRSTLRAGPWAWPGGYTLYFLTDDGAALSFEAVFENLRQVLYSIRHKIRDGWRVIGLNSTAEDDEPVVCAHTGKVIE